ncbi:MAG: hypothetical protein JST00_46635 [Deltaproteobacteria bacterium]|nr:hypothetical protein [Deltaproteobacteria bacterium]
MVRSRRSAIVLVFAALLASSAGCEEPRVARRPPEMVAMDGKEPAPAATAERGAAARGAPAKAALTTGEPVVGFDGTKFQTAFYAPVSLAVKNDRFDLVIHFHGRHQVAVDALEQSGMPVALVNVDIGVGSHVYRGAYDAAGTLDHLVGLAERSLHETGRLPNARVGRIAISAWSAGYGAARAILGRPADAARVDALLLVDGLFADWDAKRSGRPRVPSMEALAPTTAFAALATRGEKLFFLSHTAITQAQYAGPPDCADLLIKHFEAPRSAVPASARPFGGSATYVSDLGDFHVRGYDGKAFGEHAEQHRGMGAVHYAELRRFWERPKTSPAAHPARERGSP